MNSKSGDAVHSSLVCTPICLLCVWWWWSGVVVVGCGVGVGEMVESLQHHVVLACASLPLRFQLHVIAPNHLSTQAQ